MVTIINIKQRFYYLLDNFDDDHFQITQRTYNTKYHVFDIISIRNNQYMNRESYNKITITTKSNNKNNVYYIDSKKEYILVNIITKTITKLNKCVDSYGLYNYQLFENYYSYKKDKLVEKLHNKLKIKKDQVFIQEDDESESFKKVKC